MISPTHRPLTDNPQHSKQTDIRGIRIHNPKSERPQTHPQRGSWDQLHFSLVFYYNSRVKREQQISGVLRTESLTLTALNYTYKQYIAKHNLINNF